MGTTSIVALCLFGAIVAVYAPYLRVAPGVTPESIRAINLGLSQQQVEAILGHPLRVRSWGSDGTIFDYAIPHPWAMWSSSLWVYFRTGAVHSVEAKRYPLLWDERAVYGLRPDQPKWEASDFESTFRRK